MICQAAVHRGCIDLPGSVIQVIHAYRKRFPKRGCKLRPIS
ncbi:hypothetical protein [Paenibacillus sp. XY044]